MVLRYRAPPPLALSQGLSTLLTPLSQFLKPRTMEYSTISTRIQHAIQMEKAAKASNLFTKSECRHSLCNICNVELVPEESPPPHVNMAALMATQCEGKSVNRVGMMPKHWSLMLRLTTFYSKRQKESLYQFYASFQRRLFRVFPHINTVEC